jgi:polar amino acid transport system permease protein
MNDFWNWDHAAAVFPQLLHGLWITVLATVVGMVIAAILGLVVAITRRSDVKVVTVPVGILTEFIRSTPLLVQLVFANLVFTQFPALAVGCAVLGIHYATYMSEVYRAGIDAVPKGQWEASVALDLPRSRTWRAVILPQAIRNTLPGLGNYAISMFKETPFLAFIYVVEMYSVAQEYGGNNFRYMEAITLAGLLFLLVSYPTSLLVRRMENRLA